MINTTVVDTDGGRGVEFAVGMERVQLLVFSLDERHYALRLSQVVRVVRSVDCTPLPDAPGIVVGVIDVHGEIVPVLNIRDRFGLADREIGVGDVFIIARTARRPVSLVVDEVKGVADRASGEIVGSEKILPGLGKVVGVIQLEDGLTLVHDLDRFLSLDEERAIDEAILKQGGNGN